MRFIKRLFFFIFIFFLLVILFRGFIYRNFVEYDDIESRGIFVIENVSSENFKNTDINEIIDYTLNQASKKLEFKLNNPGKFMLTGKANCVGYSEFSSSYISQLLRENNLENEWKVNHKVAKLKLFGVDVHQYFSSPSFKNHDFVVIENRKTKEKIAIDPALYDYTGINRVTLK
jgi:hypothetical protein